MRDHWEPLKAGTRSFEFTQKQGNSWCHKCKGYGMEEGVSYSLWPKVDAQQLAGVLSLTPD